MATATTSTVVVTMTNDLEFYEVSISYNDIPAAIEESSFCDEYDQSSRETYTLKNKANWPKIYSPQPYKTDHLRGIKTTLGSNKTIAWNNSGGIDRRLILLDTNTFYSKSCIELITDALFDSFYPAGKKFLYGDDVLFFPDTLGSLWTYLFVPDCRNPNITKNYTPWLRPNFGLDLIQFTGFISGEYETDIDEIEDRSRNKSIQLWHHVDLRTNKFYISLIDLPTRLNGEFLPTWMGVPTNHKVYDVVNTPSPSLYWELRIVWIVIAQSSGINSLRTGVITTKTATRVTPWQTFLDDIVSLPATPPDNCFAYQVEARARWGPGEFQVMSNWHGVLAVRNRWPEATSQDVCDRTTGQYLPSIWYEVPSS